MTEKYEKPLFDFGHAISRPWRLPSGRNFLFRLVIWGAALILLVYALFGRTMISAYGEFLSVVFAVENQVEPDAEAVAAMMGSMWNLLGAATAVGILSWLVAIAMETAMHKNAFRGADHGALPLRFGMDELKVLLVQLVVFVCVFGVYFLGILVFILLVGIAGAASGGSGAGAAFAAFLGLIAILALLVLMLVVAVRLAPAAAMTVRDGDIRIFEAWKLTKPYFWPMLGAYVVVGLIGYIVIYVVMIFTVVVAFGNADFVALMSGLSEDDPQAVFSAMGEQLKSPRVFIPLVIGTMIYGLTTLAWYLHLWGIGNYAVHVDQQANEP